MTVAQTDPEAIAREFDCLMERAGITIPEGRRPSILAHYGDLRRQILLLHSVHPATLEPSNVFRVTPPGEGA